MAKKRSSTTGTTAPTNVKLTVVDKKMFSTAKEILEEEKDWVVVPWGPSVDAKTGGGILEGSLVLLQTRAKAGKTVSAMQFAVNALKQGRTVVYVDTERRLSGYKYFTINGFDLENPNLLFLRSKEGEEPIVGDDIYGLIKKMMRIPKYRGAVYIIDSFSAIVPKATAEDADVKASRRDSTPKLNADFLKQIGNILRTSKSIIVGIQHLSPDLNNHGALKPDGGEKFQYFSDYVLISKHNPLDWTGNPPSSDKSSKAGDGRMVKYQLPFNKMLAPYQSKDTPITSYIKFGEGIWWGREALDLLIDELGIAYRSGAWYYINTPDGTELKANGAEKAVLLIEEHREVFEKIIQDYFIEKYKVSYDFKKPETEEDDEE
jgi:archaellum biogenesis ATPase FlaH